MTRLGLILLAIPAVVGVDGALRLARAGRLEAAGRIEEARAGCRRGGFTLALGSAGAAAPALLLVGILPAGLLLAAGAVALLAGLSRKPRPSGWFAALLFVCGVAAALLR